MKCKLLTTQSIGQDALDEVREILNVDFDISLTKEKPVVKWNPYFKEFWVSWDWFATLFPKTYDIHCYTTSFDVFQMVNLEHKGMYRLDGNAIHEFYIGLPTKLLNTAKDNGFKTNFAYIFCHEMAHGFEHFNKNVDRVHAAVANGTLKELLAEHRRIPLWKEVLRLLRIKINLMYAAVNR